VDSWPDDAYRVALKRDCRSIILVHNHPSGKAEPSRQDREASRNLYRWGRNIGIELRNCVIIGEGGYYSFEESGALRGGGGEVMTYFGKGRILFQCKQKKKTAA
jgi:DNA repair protein RadC